MTFGEKLKSLRESKNMKQEEVAKIFNVDRSTYSKWENNASKPGFEMLIKLADFFNVPGDYLLYNDSNTPAEAALRYFLTHPEEIKKLNLGPSLLEKHYPYSKTQELVERIDKASEKTKKIINTILEMEEATDEHAAAGVVPLAKGGA